MAVFDLEASGVKLRSAALRGLADYLATELSATGAVEVVPRGDLRRRLEEEKAASYRACYDQSCQIEIGKAMAAQKTLSLTMARIGQRCIVTATLYNLQREASEAGASAECPCTEDGALAAVKGVAGRLGRRLLGVGEVAEGRARSPEPRAEDARAASPEAEREMVDVPAGRFLLGCSEAADKGCGTDGPQRRVKLPAFQIDRTEVTAEAFARCVRASVCSDSGLNSALEHEWACNWGKAGRDRHPMNCLAWEEARKYCEWRGKRLPTGDEWEAAARGADGRRYPWGNDGFTPHRRLANIADRSTQREGSGWTPGEYAEDYDDGFDGTAPVASFPDGASPSGALDMAGNVSEWIARPDPGPFSNLLVFLTARGASWFDPPKDTAVFRRRATGSTSFVGDPRIGFRCAR